MNIKHAWSVVCQSASIDVRTNFVSLFNVLEGITIPLEPDQERPLFISAEIVTLWSRVDPKIPASGLMRVYIKGPGGQVQPESIELEINITQISHRTRITIHPAAFFSSGLHLFCVEYKDTKEADWRAAAEIPFMISVDASVGKPVPAPVA